MKALGGLGILSVLASLRARAAFDVCCEEDWVGGASNMRKPSEVATNLSSEKTDSGQSKKSPVKASLIYTTSVSMKILRKVSYVLNCEETIRKWLDLHQSLSDADFLEMRQGVEDICSDGDDFVFQGNLRTKDVPHAVDIGSEISSLSIRHSRS